MGCLRERAHAALAAFDAVAALPSAAVQIGEARASAARVTPQSWTRPSRLPIPLSGFRCPLAVAGDAAQRPGAVRA